MQCLIVRENRDGKPAYIYEVEIDDSLPHGLNLLDPVKEIVHILPQPLRGIIDLGYMADRFASSIGGTIMNMFEIRSVDLNQVPGNDFIKFLRIEIPERRGYGPVRFARVRYALNGDHIEEENGLPIDLGKGIFTATLEDEELGEISREELEKTLRKAAVEILKIVREKLDTSSILKSILKDYPYLKYDKPYSKPPDVLKCRVTDPKSPRHAEDIFEIARRLHIATGENYIVTYGGSSSGNDNFDAVWTRFSLRKSNFQEDKTNV